MIPFSGLQRFSGHFGGDRPSPLNQDTTVLKFTNKVFFSDHGYNHASNSGNAIFEQAQEENHKKCPEYQGPMRNEALPGMVEYESD